jgi:predicted DNA-binding antitoxin AbrB/MazE fold protein
VLPALHRLHRFPPGEFVMAITVEAVYGVLKPSQPLPLQEQQRVEVSITPKTSWVDETAGIIGWTGSREELRNFALDPEFDPEQSA